MLETVVLEVEPVEVAVLQVAVLEVTMIVLKVLDEELSRVSVAAEAMLAAIAMARLVLQN